MRTITTILAKDDWTLYISFNDGAERRFDFKPLLDCEAFKSLNTLEKFKTFRNGGSCLD